MQSPTLARKAIGRGRLSSRSRMLLPEPKVSPLRAKTNPSGIDAPRRLSIIACGIATTSAAIFRLQGGTGVAVGCGLVGVVAGCVLAASLPTLASATSPGTVEPDLISSAEVRGPTILFAGCTRATLAVVCSGGIDVCAAATPAREKSKTPATLKVIAE